MNHFHMEWYRKEEEKREKRREENEIDLLNHQFSRLIEQLSGSVSHEKYEEEAMIYSRELVQSSIWRLGYRNNFVNPNVLTLQAGWIALLLKGEEGTGVILREETVKREFANLLHRMRYVHQQAYMNMIHRYPDIQTYL